VQLDNSVALITRAAWIDGASGVVTPLRRTDTFGAQSYNPVWNLDPGTPSPTPRQRTCREADPDPAALGFRVRPSHYAQTLNLAVASGTSFAVPDEFAWAVKYGAMQEILATNSQGYDPIRSRYCMSATAPP
jgi:hypothetical protein